MSAARSADLHVATWLNNFAEIRRDTALPLINALRLVGANDLSRRFGLLVAQLVDAPPNPVATFPVRDVKDGKAAHGDGRDGGHPQRSNVSFRDSRSPRRKTEIGARSCPASRRSPNDLLRQKRPLTLRSANDVFWSYPKGEGWDKTAVPDDESERHFPPKPDIPELFGTARDCS